MTTPGFFHQPGVFTAWALGNGDVSPEALVDRCASAGFKWIAQEFGSPDGRPDPSPDLVTRMRGECHARGIYFGMWEVAPRSLDRLTAVKPNFWILNVETDYYDYGPLLRKFRQSDMYPRLPAAVVTDCGFNPDAFKAANVKVMPECYAGCRGADPNTTVENMVARCLNDLGFKVCFPTLGVYGGAPLSRFASEIAWQGTHPTQYGSGWSVYLEDAMTSDDIAEAARMTGAAQ